MWYLAASESAGTNPLIPSPVELILGLVAFAVVFVGLGKILLPRIQKTLEERTDAIEGGIQRAEEAQAEAQRVLEQYRAQLAEARHEAARLREEAREQGAQIIAEMREQAGAEARRLVEAAGIRYHLDKHPELAADPGNAARMYGRLAFAYSASGKSGQARQWARRSIRLNWRQPRGYLAMLVSARLLSPRRVMSVAHSMGKGV